MPNRSFKIRGHVFAEVPIRPGRLFVEGWGLHPRKRGALGWSTQLGKLLYRDYFDGAIVEGASGWDCKLTPVYGRLQNGKYEANFDLGVISYVAAVDSCVANLGEIDFSKLAF
jgi:hypothetical protein